MMTSGEGGAGMLVLAALAFAWLAGQTHDAVVITAAVVRAHVNRRRRRVMRVTVRIGRSPAPHPHQQEKPGP